MNVEPDDVSVFQGGSMWYVSLKGYCVFAFIDDREANLLCNKLRAILASVTAANQPVGERGET